MIRSKARLILALFLHMILCVFTMRFFEDIGTCSQVHQSQTAWQNTQVHQSEGTWQNTQVRQLAVSWQHKLCGLFVLLTVHHTSMWSLPEDFMLTSFIVDRVCFPVKKLGFEYTSGSGENRFIWSWRNRIVFIRGLYLYNVLKWNQKNIKWMMK